MLKKKEKNKKRKLYHFYDLIDDFNYYDFSSGILTIDDIPYKGCMYILDHPDKDKLEKILEKYDNTYMTTRHRVYTPEHVETCLFIAR